METRRAALECLSTVSPSRAAAEAGQAFDAQDRAFLVAMVEMVVRRRRTLDAVGSAFASGGRIAPPLMNPMRLGLCQLLLLEGIPGYAAIHETVEAVRARGGRSGHIRFVNGLLRSVERSLETGGSGPRRELPRAPGHSPARLDRDVLPDPADPEFMGRAYSYPDDLVAAWTGRFGPDQARDLMDLGNRTPPTTLRPNPRHGDEASLAEALADEGIKTAPGPRPGLLDLPGRPRPAFETKAFRNGLFSVQDAAALDAVGLVEAADGEPVLDLCAAPGGKACALAERGAAVVADDPDDERLALVGSGAERLGVAVEVRPPEEAELFPWVLADVPCSNSGVLDRRPEARWRFGDKARESLLAIQDDVLDRAASHTAPGGCMVYSTCAIEHAENSERVRAFMIRNEGWALEAETERLPGPGHGGGYAARLRLE